MIKLKAEIREKGKKPEALRKLGILPGVFYGKKEASTPISIKEIDFLKAWKEAGESTVITLDTPNGEVESLIHDVDFDPISGRPRHADFYVFEKGHKVKVEVPLEIEGVSPAVKDLGGTLVTVLHNIKIEAVPRDLPKNIPVDISGLLEFNNQILAKDLKLPSGVTLLEKEDEVVLLVAPPREEKEEEAAPVDLSQIEVEEKGKKAEEGEEGAEGSAGEEKKEKKEEGK